MEVKGYCLYKCNLRLIVDRWFPTPHRYRDPPFIGYFLPPFFQICSTPAPLIPWLIDNPLKGAGAALKCFE